MTSTGTPTLEGLKEKAKVIRSFMKEKYSVDVSHGHCMEMASKIFGFKDWNTASAALKPNVTKKIPLGEIQTVGHLRDILNNFKDSDYVDADYEFTVKQLRESAEETHWEDLDDEDVITQQFSIGLERADIGVGEPRFLSFKLTLEDETSTF